MSVATVTTMRLGLAALITVCFAFGAACSSDNGGDSGIEEPRGDPAAENATDLRFEYQSIGSPGYIDQTLTIRNGSDSAVAPTLEFEPVGSDGEPLPGVAVSTVFGSDKGRVVVPPDGAVDILRFEPAERIGDVVDVRVTVVSIDDVDPVGDGLLEASPMAGGEAIDKFAIFDAVEIQNPTEYPVTARLVFIVYDNPPAGRSQQAEHVYELAGPVDIAAGESSIAQVAPDFEGFEISAERAVSIKAYASR